MSLRWLVFISLTLFSASFVGCTEKPQVQEIHYGEDYCEHCKMQITDKRFGGVLLTKFGKTLKYDSIECLAHGKHDHHDEVSEIQIVDYKTQKLVPYGKAELYKNEQARGPMGTIIQGLSEASSLPKLKLEEVEL